MKKKRFMILLLCSVLALSLTGCGAEKVEKQIFAMDTVMTLTAYGKNAETGLNAAVNTINSFDAMLDPENEDSVAFDMNHAGGEATVVRGQVVEMLEAAREVYDRSGGAFDLSVYPLVKAWGFIDGNYVVPTEEQITAARELLGFDKIKITGFADSADSLVTMPTGTQVSFGAIAKGCASDYAIAALRSAGVESAIISLGGNVQTLGRKPDGSDWSIAVQDPNDTGSYVGVLKVGETAVVTSGGYQRYFDTPDGVRYHHIIDPSTGYPSTSGLVSATIVCPDGELADALSTTMYILGENAALEYWRTYGGFEMVLVTEDGRVVVTSGLYDRFTSYGETYRYEFASQEAAS